MKELHIVSVGISLITNFARAAGLEVPEAAKRNRALRDYLKRDPRVASAEVNALAAIQPRFLRGAKAAGLAVALVEAVTTGSEGRLAARLIGNLLKEKGAQVSTITIRELDLPARKLADPEVASRLATEGLIALYDKLERHITRIRKRHLGVPISINATGGFKAETAILYGLGCDLGLPVYYLHESYRVPVELPPCAVPF
jgi:putative CRISPR-associated protein (TIGR02619 family)